MFLPFCYHQGHRDPHWQQNNDIILKKREKIMQIKSVFYIFDIKTEIIKLFFNRKHCADCVQLQKLS